MKATDVLFDSRDTILVLFEDEHALVIVFDAAAWPAKAPLGVFGNVTLHGGFEGVIN